MAYGGQEVLHVVQHDQRRAALAHAVGDRLQRRADGIAVGADGSALFGSIWSADSTFASRASHTPPA